MATRTKTCGPIPGGVILTHTQICVFHADLESFLSWAHALAGFVGKWQGIYRQEAYCAMRGDFGTALASDSGKLSPHGLVPRGSLQASEMAKTSFQRQSKAQSASSVLDLKLLTLQMFLLSEPIQWITDEECNTGC